MGGGGAERGEGRNEKGRARGRRKRARERRTGDKRSFITRKFLTSQVGCCMPVSPALGIWTEEDQDFEIILGYIVSWRLAWAT